VSGTASAAAPAVRPRRTVAPGRPLTIPQRPRRVSGPARRGVDDRPARRRSKDETGIALGLLAALEGLSRHRLLGGRTWIALVAFALIGIVTLQLGLLKLNAGIGRALERGAVLQRENAALSIENSELAASDRVTSGAVRLGMELVPTGALRFLQARPRIDAARDVAALGTPLHTTATGAGEAPAAGSSVLTSSSASSASTEQSTTGLASASVSAEPSSTESATPSRGAEPSSTGSVTTSASGESPGRASGGPTSASGESTSAPATASPSATVGARSRSAEGTPAGGTQAGPSG
jgi:hypothetical protein